MSVILVTHRMNEPVRESGSIDIGRGLLAPGTPRTCFRIKRFDG